MLHSIRSFVRPLLVAGLLASASAGCEIFTPCGDIARAGLVITVMDDTGVLLPAQITLADGDYMESIGTTMPGEAPGPYAGAYERPGIYDIVVVSPGYESARIEDVKVEDDGCHVDGQEIDIVLRRVQTACGECEPGSVCVRFFDGVCNELDSRCVPLPEECLDDPCPDCDEQLCLTEQFPVFTCQAAPCVDLHPDEHGCYGP